LKFDRPRQPDGNAGVRWARSRSRTSAYDGGGERIPIVRGQDAVGSPSDIGEGAPHRFKVVVDRRRNCLIDVEIDLAGDVADNGRSSDVGLNVNTLVTGRVGIGVKNALKARKELDISLDQFNALP